MDTVQVENSASSLKLAALAKCAHPACTCTVASGERFCSDYCAEPANADAAAADDGCSCGHLECAHATGAGRVPAASILG
jgi:hypothetical protein